MKPRARAPRCVQSPKSKVARARLTLGFGLWILDFQYHVLSRFPQTARARRRCCRKCGRNNPVAASDGVAGKIRDVAPRRFGVRARARPAGEKRRARKTAERRAPSRRVEVGVQALACLRPDTLKRELQRTLGPIPYRPIQPR